MRSLGTKIGRGRRSCILGTWRVGRQWLTHLGRHYRLACHNKDESSNAMTLILTHLWGHSHSGKYRMNPETNLENCGDLWISPGNTLLSEVFIIWLQDMVSWLILVSLDSPVGGWVGLGLGGLGLRTGVSVTETGNWLLGRQTSDGQEAARCFYQLLPRTGCQSCGSLVRRGRH